MNRKFIRRLLAVVVAVSLLQSGIIRMLPTTSVQAATDGVFEYDDLGDGTAIITGYTGDNGENVIIPSSVGSGLAVVEIGLNAFRGRQLPTLTIPNSVTKIGQGAFENNELNSLILPDSVATIGVDAFRGNRLSTLTIPNSVTTIEQGAFLDNELTSVILPNGITAIGVDAFRGNHLSAITIPSSVTTIEQGAFEENELTSVILNDGITTIGVDAFRYNQLSALTIPNSVTTIGQGAFLNNELTRVTLPDSLASIGVEAFKNNRLTSIMIPANVMTIEQGAFGNNFSLSDVGVLSQTVEFKNGNIFGGSTNLTLYGYAGSTAQTFATANGRPFQLFTAVLADLELDIPGLTFDPAERSFTLTTNANGVRVKPTPVVPFSEVKVNDDLVPYGEYSLSIALTEGTVTITLDVEAPDDTVEQYNVTLNVDHSSPTIGLTASPTTLTNGNVTVSVDADDTGSGIAGVKWAAGSQVEAFFATGGQVLTGGSFEATTNGTYTVYARDNAGNETVETIAINNIDRNAPTIGLTVDPTSVTNGNVTVTVAANASSGISALKWAAGNQGAPFFATDGEAVVSSAFTVAANGTYTVYARDNAGNETVETIAITNIDRNAPTIGLTADPTSTTNGNVTVTVAANASSGIASVKWAAGNQGAPFFATDGEAVVSNAFTVAANGTYTVYARDNAGNEAVETIAITNIDRNAPTIGLTADPTSATNGNVTVTVATTASSGIASVKWAAGNQGAPFFATDGEAVVSNAFTVTANGTYTVYARDNAGNEAVETITISNIVPPASYVPTPPDTPKEDSEPRPAIVIEPGVIIIKVTSRDIKVLPKDTGGYKEVVTLPDDIWDEFPKLLDQEDRPVIRIIIDNRQPDAELHLPGRRLAEVSDVNPNVEVDMQLNGSSFQLKVNVLDLEQLAAQLGIAVDEMNVIVKIAALEGAPKEAFVQAAVEQALTLLSQVIEFQLIVASGDESVEITDFGGTYMTKSIVLDDQFADRNYMAVLYDPGSRAFTYVPAVMANRSDGEQEAVIQMPHNSIYAVVEADWIEFADMQGHWAESEVEQLGSKRIVKGVTADGYAPNRNVTRAEYASLLVRALGIKTEHAGVGDVFEDVAAASWYAVEVEAAYRAGLVQGISSTQFAPEAQITREQIAVMLMNAMALVNGASKPAIQTPDSLTPFTDASEVSAWARDAMSHAVASKLIEGLPGDRLVPAAPATRAQAAIMLHRLLVMIEFLD